MAHGADLQLFPTVNKTKVLQPAFVRDEDERPNVAYNEFGADHIPLISLSGLNGAERNRVREEMKAACEEWGIFHVVDHGVSQDVVKRMSQLSRDFFALSPAEKLKYDMRGGKRGGFVVSSHLQGETVLDWREIFIYFSFPVGTRDYTRWSEKPQGWREIVEKYSEELMNLACKILEVISEPLGLEREAVRRASLNLDQKIFVNFYPKCPQPNMTLGVKRHTDPGTITLLFQDQVGGLQVTKDGHTWITVKPVEPAFVVNLGDHMHMDTRKYLSNGKYKNVDHRAVVNSDSSRLSIATFQNPGQDAVVVNMDEADKCIMEEPITFAQMYSRKMNRDLELARLKETGQNFSSLND